MSAEVKPLNAIIYNSDKINMKDVTAPPYDVITEAQRLNLLKKSPYNIVSLILPEGSSDVSDENNRYKVACEHFRNMLEEKVLVKTEKPVVFYLYQRYKKDENEIIRKGFMARIRLQEFGEGNIFPHEYTMSGPKADRLNLTKECKVNFSPVFLVYSDKERQLEEAAKAFESNIFADITDEAGVRHTVFKIEDENFINLVRDVIKEQKLLIADGHHRYETALNYSKFINSSDKNHPSKFVMAYFTNKDDDLLIFPTHRIITKELSMTDILHAVEKYFYVEEISFTRKTKDIAKRQLKKRLEEAGEYSIVMGLYLKNEDKFRILKLRKNVDGIMDMYNIPDVLRSLDLVVLHTVILKKELGFTDEELINQNGIQYIKQDYEAFDAVDSLKASASFIMASPKIEDIYDISEAGERMPQKSTYFYPKLLSGIAINPLE